MLRVLLALAFTATCRCAGISFITLGDWGGAALEEPTKPYSQNVKNVAQAMSKTAAATNAKFIVNTGDSFYWCGLQNASDFQVAKDWLNPYSSASLQVPWYGVLGNHEYAYNVQATIDLGKKYKNWVMDARYYMRRLQLSGSNYATLIFLDTSPCQSEYRSTNPGGWDPCSQQYPTCSLSGGSDNFEGKCNFHPNIMTQDCSAQLTWFKKQLAAVPKDDWLIVVGHAPADEIDVEDFTTAMQQHGFDLYLNGHIHTLTHYQIDGSGAYVCSGAGALVITHDQLGGTPAKDRVYNKANDLFRDELATRPFGQNVTAGRGGHTYKSLYNAKVSGYTLHTFNDDYTVLTTQLLDTSNTVLHEFNITKGATPPPGPSPAPGPAPGPNPSPPAGNCCYHKSQSCASGQTCCSSSGKSYQSQGTCERYGAAHHCAWSGTVCVVNNGTAATR